MQVVPDDAMLEDLVLERFLSPMTDKDFSAFGAEGARGIKIELAVHLPVLKPAAESESVPLSKPQAHQQEVSELDELVVAGVQPNQEAVAQDILKRILLITGEIMHSLIHFSYAFPTQPAVTSM